nr:MAG TPA_asm: foot protein [Caudoviricetes sp.]
MHSTRRTSSPKRRKSRMTLILAIILTICTLWLTSCTTTRTAESKPAPQYYPPDPYTADGSLVWTYDKETDTVTMPWWYWKKVYDYIVNTQASQEIHKEIK